MLQNIKLENFRNHAKKEFELAQITVFIGKNGVGKSNILEAVSLLSFCKSFREENKRNLISYDADFARVVGGELEVFIQKEPIALYKAKSRGVFRRKVDFIGLMPAVIFSPETMAIITGGPKERRRFLDAMISQVDRDYLLALISFEKVKEQRNSLLQNIAKGFGREDELDYWDEKFVEHASTILAKRNQAISFFNQRLSQLYETISGLPKQALEINYIQTLTTEIKDNLSANRRREIASGRSLFGPHRDDIIINLNSHNMANYASRGEIRSGVLALKIAEINYLEQNHPNHQIKPILLLDDIFSEFDKDRRSYLGKLIQGYQTIITTTDEEFLSPDLKTLSKVIRL